MITLPSAQIEHQQQKKMCHLLFTKSDYFRTVSVIKKYVCSWAEPESSTDSGAFYPTFGFSLAPTNLLFGTKSANDIGDLSSYPCSPVRPRGRASNLTTARRQSLPPAPAIPAPDAIRSPMVLNSPVPTSSHHRASPVPTSSHHRAPPVCDRKWLTAFMTIISVLDQIPPVLTFSSIELAVFPDLIY